MGFQKPGTAKGATYRELATFPLVCLLPAGHPLAQRETLQLEDLKGERLVLLPLERTLPQAAKLQGVLLEGKPPEEVYLCGSGEAIATLVGGGFGVAILPKTSRPLCPMARWRQFLWWGWSRPPSGSTTAPTRENPW